MGQPGEAAARGDGRPVNLRLHPNPTAGELLIALRFGPLPHGATAMVTISDVHGRLVRRMPARLDRGAEEELRWDARDSRGVQVPAGIYLVRAEVGSTSVVRKAVVAGSR